MKRLAFLLIALAAGLGLSGSAQAAGWGPEFPVSKQPSGYAGIEGASAIPFDDGRFVYVWANGDATNAGVRTRVAYPDGSLGPIKKIVGGFEFSIPTIAVAEGTDEENRIVFLIRSKGCSACQYEYSLRMGQIDERGELVDMPQVLDSTAPSIDNIDPPDLSVAPDGSSMVAWGKYQSGPGYIVRVALAPPGEEADVYDATDPGTTYGAPTVAAKNGGGGFIALQGGFMVPAVIGAMVDPDGSASEFEDMAAGEYGGALKSVIDSNGKATVAFRQSVGGQNGLYFRQMGSDGEAIGSDAALVDQADNLGFDEGSLTLAPDGKIAIAWPEFDTNDSLGKSWIRQIGSDGSLGTTHRLGNPSEDVGMPQVAYGPSGPLVTISALELPDGERRVDAIELGGDLAPVDPPTTIATYLPNDLVSAAALVFSPTGEATAAWSTVLSELGFASRVDAAIYDTAAPELEVWIPSKTTQGFDTVMAARADDRNGPVTFEWNYGDSVASIGQENVNHTFNNTGTFDVTVTATDSVGNAATETVSVEVEAVPDPNPPTPPVAPETTITGKPGKKLKAKTATFKFVSDQAGSKFECRLDKAGWTDCKSPRKLKKLKPGKHIFRVRATRGDLIDLSPASYSWTVRKTKKRR